MTSRIVVTAGPTVSAADIATYLPAAETVAPIVHGDTYAYGLRAGDTLVVIDGRFLQVASVRHRELLDLLDAGVAVLGASSMGALRAAELHPLGMVGSGAVFRGFVSGELDGDDEVAVVHGLAEDGYPIFAEALVNIRATLAAAEATGVLRPGERPLLLSTAAQRSFERRSWADILADLVARDAMNPARAALLRDALRAGRVDLKRDDAVRLLESLAAGASPADIAAESGLGVGVRRAPQRSYFTRRWRLAHTPSADGLGSGRLVATAAVVATDFPRWRHDQLMELAASMHACALALPAADDPLERWAARLDRPVPLLLEGAADVGVDAPALRRYAARVVAADTAVAAVTGVSLDAVPMFGAARTTALERVAAAHLELSGLVGADGTLPAHLLARIVTEAEQAALAPTAIAAAVLTRTFARWPAVPVDDDLVVPLRLSGQLPRLRDIITASLRAGVRYRELRGTSAQRVRPELLDEWLTSRWGSTDVIELARRGLGGMDLRAAAGPLLLLDRLVGVPEVLLTPVSATAA